MQPRKLHAQEDIFFAGVAFTGEMSSQNDATPYSSRLLDREGVLRMNALLVERIKGSEEFNIIFDQLARLDGSTSQKAMAIAIDRDIVVEENINGLLKVIYELSSQILIFDFETGLIIESIPINIQIIDVSDQANNSTKSLAVFEEMIFDIKSSQSLINQVVDEISMISVTNNQMRLKINLIDAIGLNENLQVPVDIGTLGNDLTKILSTGIDRGLLPFGNGAAIGNVIPSRFADGSVYRFVIPEADYYLDFKVQKTVVQSIDGRSNRFINLIGAFVNVVIYERTTGRRYVDVNFKFANTKTIPGNSSIVYSPILYEVVLQAFAKFLENIESRDAQWISAQDSPRDVGRQISNLIEFKERLR